MSLPIPAFMKRWFYPLLRKVVKHEIISAPSTFTSAMNIYDIALTTIQHTSTTVGAYKGKKLLLVNIASECGYTPQLDTLQKFHELYKDKVEVLGFPCNDFGVQEPGSDEVIATFCSKNYGVSFPLFSKLEILGDHPHPLYKYLSDPAQNGWNSKLPTWNFCKYLIDENGKLLKYFGASVDPLDPQILECL
jgi:glutathione peroxidase